ncbi:MAG: hypothetical protein AAGI01_00310, partial [Myxococcota bacterium]
MAQETSNNSTQMIVGFIAVALLAFTGGYFVGSSSSGSATGDATAVGGAAAPEFADKDGAANKFAPQDDSDLIPVGTSATFGPKDAPITVVEFSD